MNVLISGGCKNGKTAFAQNVALRLSREGRRYYVATMIPLDDEDRARIDRHVRERAGMGFETLECGRDLAGCFRNAQKDATFLVDSVTALLVHEMFPDAHEGQGDPNAVRRCLDGLLTVAKNAEHAVFVSDYLFSDAARYDDFTEQYRASLASLDRALAQVCDCVIELCAGNAIFHKGGTVL